MRKEAAMKKKRLMLTLMSSKVLKEVIIRDRFISSSLQQPNILTESSLRLEASFTLDQYKINHGII